MRQTGGVADPGGGKTQQTAVNTTPSPGSGQPAAGSARFSRLQVDVKVEEPERKRIRKLEKGEGVREKEGGKGREGI